MGEPPSWLASLADGATFDLNSILIRLLWVGLLLLVNAFFVAAEFALVKARHFRMVDVPGLPEEHPEYNIWMTADDDYVLLKAEVGGYMQTAYELTEYSRS